MSLLNNECKYPTCDKIYSSLSDLITHIEQDHLDFSLQKIEQLEIEKPEHLPLSYVLKYSNNEDPPPKYSSKIVDHKYSFNEYILNDSYEIPHYGTYVENQKRQHEDNFFGTELRLRNDSIAKIIPYKSSRIILPENHKKPFACTMPGCHKRYKNVNGVKYHYKSYHKFSHTPLVKRSVLKYNHNLFWHQPKVKVESTHPDLQSYHLRNFAPPPLHNEINYQTLPHLTTGIGSSQSSSFSSSLKSDEHFNDINNINYSYYSIANNNGDDIKEFSLGNSSQFHAKY